jgi:hypothetical protein
MHLPLVVLTSFVLTACASPAAEQGAAPDPNAALGPLDDCFTLQLGGTPAPDVALPGIIRLSRDPAPGFVEPGRLAVIEPGITEPQAPVSWWVPSGANALQLVLGGGYTGYSFALKSLGGGVWAGQGTYFADFGVEPTPPSLPLRLGPRSCP